MGSILGGGGSKGSSSQSGYSALPQILHDTFNPLGQAVGQFTNPNNPGVVNRFTPLAQTADETRAFDQFRQGFAPTSQSIASDIAMQQNPFDQYVINGINREAQGKNSILQQNQNAAGQLGSNRGMLGANDIDLTRLNQIGGFLQNNYDKSLNNAINVLPQQRSADASALLGIGDFQRNLQSQTNLAPISALQAGTSMISPFTAGGTSQAAGQNNTLGNIGNLASGIGSAWMAFSDRDVKFDIVPIGQENGHNIYEFSYIPEMNTPGRFIGVIAQEVLEKMPEAVIDSDGYLAVNYDMIGVRMREVSHG